MTECRRYHTAIQIFRSIKHYSPSYLLDIFWYSKDVTGYCGHNANHLFIPRVSTNFGKRSFFYRGTMLWNSLPSTVVEATTLSSFKYLYFNYYKDVIIVVVFAFVYCFIVYCFILCYCVCLYVVSQGSTENQLC